MRDNTNAKNFAWIVLEKRRHGIDNCVYAIEGYFKQM